MKYQGIESKIDPKDERDAILKFLDRYWDISFKSKKPLTEAIDYILQTGIKYGIALHEKEVQQAVDFYNRMVDYANSENKNVPKIDFQRTTSDEDSKGHFALQAGLVETTLKKEWKISAKPKGYEAFKQAYDSGDFADIDENLEFEGTRLHDKIGASCPDLPDYLKKGNIYYSEENQNRTPLREMVGAILRQGMNIGIRVVEQKYGTPMDLYKTGHKVLEERK